jgi:hypothetical protein
MSGVNIPIEIYDLLERRLGRDDAMAVAKSIEASLTHIEERSREMAVQRKIEAKEELRVELRNELATKEDMLAVKEDMLAVREDLTKLEGAMNARFERMDKKFTVLFMVTIFTVIFLNQNALEFLARIIGLIK